MPSQKKKTRSAKQLANDKKIADYRKKHGCSPREAMVALKALKEGKKAPACKKSSGKKATAKKSTGKKATAKKASSKKGSKKGGRYSTAKKILHNKQEAKCQCP